MMKIKKFDKKMLVIGIAIGIAFSYFIFSSTNGNNVLYSNFYQLPVEQFVIKDYSGYTSWNSDMQDMCSYYQRDLTYERVQGTQWATKIFDTNEWFCYPTLLNKPSNGNLICDCVPKQFVK